MIFKQLLFDDFDLMLLFSLKKIKLKFFFVISRFWRRNFYNYFYKFMNFNHHNYFPIKRCRGSLVSQAPLDPGLKVHNSDPGEGEHITESKIRHARGPVHHPVRYKQISTKLPVIFFYKTANRFCSFHVLLFFSSNK